MSNILNHNRNTFDFRVSKSDYWDMHLHKKQSGGHLKNGLQDDCLGVYIDTNTPGCVGDNELVSMNKYSWFKAVNKGIELNNIGFTGVDNGLLIFDKDNITEEEFNEIYRHSTLEIDGDDMRLHLANVNGNNKIYSYNTSFATEHNFNVSKLNGGFYQGFFKTDKGCDYQILPSKLNNGWCMEFVLKPEFNGFEENELPTLNDIYPDNQGIFFYVGTRAENKWYKYYNSGEETDLQTSDGINITSTDKLIETDNKHITYNRTKEGYKANEGRHDESITVSIEDCYDEENYFLIMNRTKNGYTAETIGELKNKETKEKYDVLSDLFRNALAFQIKNDGSIGYKYMVKDCDSDEGYSIKEEWSYPDMIKNDKWYHIAVRVVPVIKYGPEKFNYVSSVDYMRLMFYVNGRLVLYSKEIPTLLLRVLNDTYSKQEAVPYNISLGGGTQGLCDVIYSLDSVPEDILYLEKEFGGSFIGYFKAFRFHTCNLNYQELYQNFIVEKFLSFDLIDDGVIIPPGPEPEPVRPDALDIFYGTYNMFIDHQGLLPSQIPITDEDILGLNKIKAINKEFEFDIPIGINRIIIAYPSAIGPIEKIIDEKSFGFNIVIAFKIETRYLFVYGNYEEYYVYSLDYAFLNETENTYKVKIK